MDGARLDDDGPHGSWLARYEDGNPSLIAAQPRRLAANSVQHCTVQLNIKCSQCQFCHRQMLTLLPCMRVALISTQFSSSFSEYHCRSMAHHHWFRRCQTYFKVHIIIKYLLFYIYLSQARLESLVKTLGCCNGQNRLRIDSSILHCIITCQRWHVRENVANVNSMCDKSRRQPTFKKYGDKWRRFTVPRLVDTQLYIFKNARDQISPRYNAVAYILTDLFFTDTKRLHRHNDTQISTSSMFQTQYKFGAI